MVGLFMPNVGDGLAAMVVGDHGERVQIDCGGGPRSFRRRAALLSAELMRPDTFVLSHYHLDHYNGLVEAAALGSPRFAIREVCFPRIPVLPGGLGKTYLRCALAMNEYLVLGNRSGSMAADLLHLLSRLNRRPFSYRALAEGDEIKIDGEVFTVLWPPRAVAAGSDEIVGSVRNAIEAFERAKEEDETLRQIETEIVKRRLVYPYLEGRGTWERREWEGPSSNRDPWRPIELARDLPPAVAEANEALRRAANRLSLAFASKGRFLFLGDLEPHEIQQVAEKLADREWDRFLVGITPHHGTHWQSSLEEIAFACLFTSVGPRLFDHLYPEYRRLTPWWFVTHVHGDLGIPPAGPWFTGGLPTALSNERWWRFAEGLLEEGERLAGRFPDSPPPWGGPVSGWWPLHLLPLFWDE